jgi:carboxyl-terminal processing protease
MAKSADTEGREGRASSGDALPPETHSERLRAGEARPGARAQRSAATRALRFAGYWAQALLVLIFVLLGGIYLGGHPSDLPPFMREAFESGGAGSASAEALSTIERDYFRRVSPSALASASIAGAIASLHDPFSHYLSASEYRTFASPGDFSGVGLEAAAGREGLLIERVFNSSPAQRAGLRPGEEIIAVNGRSLHGVPAETARNMIRGPAGTAVALTVRSGKRSRSLTITRAEISEPVVASGMRTYAGKKIGVVYLASFSAGAHSEVREAVEKLLREGARGLVLDLRHNGGGLVAEAQQIASIFIPHGVIVSMRGRVVAPLTLYALGDAISTRIPMAVLVDHDTASAAEITTAALQDDHRATVVGTHTYGKGVFQELLPLRNGGALDLTVGEYFTPNGRNLGGGGVKEGAGITPEVLLPDSQVDTEAGLTAALRTVAAKL